MLALCRHSVAFSSTPVNLLQNRLSAVQNAISPTSFRCLKSLQSRPRFHTHVRSISASAAMSASSAPVPVDPARVSRLKTGVEPQHGTHVLYWMSTSMRTIDNAALEYAAQLSNRFKLPLRIAHVLFSVDADGEALTERHAIFHLQGMADVSNALKERKIPFIIVHVDSDSVQDTLKRFAKGAVSVVIDADYLRPGRKLRAEFARVLKVPFYVVEANVIVPLEQASQKAEHAARTIRPKINKLVPHFQKTTAVVDLKFQGDDVSDKWVDSLKKSMDPVTISTDKDVESVLSKWEGLDRDAPRVDMFPGGEDAAQKRLNKFVGEQLGNYEKGRNEPALQLQSDMSPYLRAGHISPVVVAQRVCGAATSGNRASRDAFLEELIVRRELAANACFFNAMGYDTYEGAVPNFAQISLELHASDKRTQTYSFKELEAGVTGDAYWNAAQLELLVRGKMHGYMRMYWAKQIIGWVDCPKEALRITTRLNNRWQLDAIDPNSYVGVNWCYGLHDQGWRERPVWGKVRYMNDAGLKRKFNMAAYVAMVDKMIQKNGLPRHVEQIRRERKASLVGKQSTIMDTLTKKKRVVRKKKSGDEDDVPSRPAKRSKT